jgi:hypothetical protein
MPHTLVDLLLRSLEGAFQGNVDEENHRIATFAKGQP